MAGHSKWSNIKHKKAKMDAQKGKVYTKFSKLIIVAVREGGPDPNGNSRLKDIIEKAKEANMPNDNIMRAIKRGSGELDSSNYEEIMYEGYGPGGVAILLDVMTDNRNRTAGDMRHLFDKYGGNLGETGCVAWMFEKKGLIIVEKTEELDIEKLMMLAIDSGADDVEEEEDSVEITAAVEQYENLKKILIENKFETVSAEITFLPKTTVNLAADQSERLEKLIEIFEDHDDVQNVYNNYEPLD
jgi:YebC/PmpR family DNA-binding regulatory protein